MTASELLNRAVANIERRDWEGARRWLDALLALDPGGHLAGRIRHLGKTEGLPEDIAERIQTCVSLAHTSRRDPREDAFEEAARALAGRPS
jgi:hypothetical protein